MKIRDLLLLCLVCFVVFWWRLGALGLIDPDEPFYAQTAREMVQTGDWTTPQIFGQPQFEKPIFFYWMTAASFVVFGESEFSARVASALPGTLTVLLVYLFTVRVFGRRTGFLSALVLATGLEFAIMSRLMLTDIALALFIAGSLFSYWLAMQSERDRDKWMIAHFICGGLGVLTKGPIATLVSLFATIAFRIVTKRPMPYRGKGLWLGLLVYAIISVPWYAIMIAKHGWRFVDSFFIHENLGRLIFAEHPTNNHPFYYIIILLLGSVPWLPVLVLSVRRGLGSMDTSAAQTWAWIGIVLGFVGVTVIQPWVPLAVAFPLVVISQLAILWAAWRGARGRQYDERRVFLWCWILTSFVFLTIAQSKLPSYIFYLFVPVAQLVGLTLDDLLTSGFRSGAERSWVAGLTVLELLAIAAVPFVPQAKPFTMPTMLAGACFAVALLFLMMRAYRAWIVVNSMVMAALVVGALVLSLDNVQAVSSSKPVAQEMTRERQGSEPFLAGKFLARGIYYYTGQPVSVISASSKPFWTDHPLPVVAGKKGLREFLKQNKSAVVTVRRSEWPYWKTLHVTPNDAEPEWWGDNAVIRMVKPEGK